MGLFSYPYWDFEQLNIVQVTAVAVSWCVQ